MTIHQTLPNRLLQDGYVIVREILPPTLVEEGCRAYAPLVQLARAEYGWQAQRFQPLNRAPGFNNELLVRIRSHMNVGLKLVFNQEYTCCHPGTCGVLINPGPVEGSLDQEVPRDYVMPPHRDWFKQKPHADVGHLMRNWRNQLCWYQFNLALYDDESFFVVPGSQKYIDLELEAERSRGQRYCQSERPVDYGFVDRYWQTQCNALDTKQVELAAGDIVIYHAGMLHGSGDWVNRPRLTLHDFCDTPAFREFRQHQNAAWKTGKDAGATPWWQIDSSVRASELTKLSIHPVRH